MGDKVKLHVMDMEDILLDNPEAPIEIRGGDQERHGKMVEHWRQESRDIEAQVSK